MSELSRLERRLQLCEGHWALGETEEALQALERAALEFPGEPRVIGLAHELGERSLAEADTRGRERLARILAAAGVEAGGDLPVEPSPVEEEPSLPSLATSTLAELLAQQGHHEQALRVAEDVLRRNPEDARARAVRTRLLPPPARPGSRPLRELERWLANARRLRSRRNRQQGEAIR